MSGSCWREARSDLLKAPASPEPPGSDSTPWRSSARKRQGHRALLQFGGKLSRSLTQPSQCRPCQPQHRGRAGNAQQILDWRPIARFHVHRGMLRRCMREYLSIWLPGLPQPNSLQTLAQDAQWLPQDLAPAWSRRGRPAWKFPPDNLWPPLLQRLPYQVRHEVRVTRLLARPARNPYLLSLRSARPVCPCL